jgi:hypothetical protein
MKNKVLYIVEAILLLTVILIIVLYKTEVISGEINKETKDEILMSSEEETLSHIFSYDENDISTNPYYYFNGTEYVLINTTILPINYNGYDYGVNGHQAYFKSNLAYGDAIQYCKDGYCFTIQPTKVTYRNAYLSNDDIYSSINFSSIGYANESKFVWENVFGNYNLTYDYTVNSLKEELVISEPRAPAPYLGDVNNITLDFDTYIKYPVGVDIYYNDSIITNNIVVDGDIEFRNSSGHVLYYLPTPFVVDSIGHKINAQYQIVFNGKYNSNKIREIYFYVQVPFVELNSSEIVYPIRIDPTVQFASGDTVRSVSVAAITENTFALAWCDWKAEDVFFKVYYTNGTIISSDVTVDNSVGNCDRTGVSVTALSSTTLVVGYIDQQDDDATFYTYYTNGTAIAGPIDVDTDIYNDWDVNSISTTALSETSFVIAWVDSQDDDATYAAYWINGTAIKTATDVDTSISDTDPAVSVSALTSEKFVIGWYDYDDYDITFAVYWVNGTVISGPIDEDTSTAGSKSVSVAAITDKIFVIGYPETGGQDAVFSVYWINGTRMKGPIIVDNDIGVLTTSVEVSRIDGERFVMSWYDEVDDDQTFAVYYINTTLIAGPTDSVNSAATSMYWQDVFSSELVSGIGFCDGNFIHAFTVNSTYASWISYYSNGTAWDGNCAAGITSCASYNAATNEYYVPAGCQCYCDASLGPILDITKCSCIEV